MDDDCTCGWVESRKLRQTVDGNAPGGKPPVIVVGAVAGGVVVVGAVAGGAAV